MTTGPDSKPPSAAPQYNFIQRLPFQTSGGTWRISLRSDQPPQNGDNVALLHFPPPNGAETEAITSQERCWALNTGVSKTPWQTCLSLLWTVILHYTASSLRQLLKWSKEQMWQTLLKKGTLLLKNSVPVAILRSASAIPLEWGPGNSEDPLNDNRWSTGLGPNRSTPITALMTWAPFKSEAHRTHYSATRTLGFLLCSVASTSPTPESMFPPWPPVILKSVLPAVSK